MLTQKQESFCLAYVETGNTAEAYRMAYGKSVPEGGKFYVYLLTDPRDGRVFYVGKGTGDRKDHHVRDALAGRITNVAKHRRIADIHACGLKVSVFVVHSGDSEAEAYAVERALIVRWHDGLTNMLSGVADQKELATEKALQALSQLKSFDDWLASASPEQLAAATALNGSPRNFYEAHALRLCCYAAGVFP